MDAFRDYLEEFFSVVEVSGSTQWKLEGGECPFCGESRTDLRLYVNSSTGVGVCHHCSKGFTAVSFIMANEGCSHKKAVGILNGHEDGWATERPEEKVVESGLISPKCVSALDSRQALDYLMSRGIGEAEIKHFRLLWATENVVINGKTYWTAKRIVIPIFDSSCVMVSWQARDTTGTSSQKYLFPPGFKGREYVYNICGIPDDPDYLIVSEGVFDVFGWWRSGFRNVVATFGKKMTEEQALLIRSKRPKILLVAWDTDATWNKYELVEKIGCHFQDVRIIDLKGRDADELRRDALLESFKQASRYSWEDKILSAL